MEITGTVAGMIKLLGEGDTVDITPIVTSGTKIASIVVNEGKPDEQSIDLYSPEVVVDYDNLTGKPSINGQTLTGNKTTSELGLFSGSYNDLTDKPTLFSGSYNDLTNKPTIPQILNGTEAPSSGLGNNGDLYIQYQGSPSAYIDYEITDLPVFEDRVYTPVAINVSTYDAIRVVGGGIFGSYDTVLLKSEIPTYNGEDYKNNVYNYNWANEVGISKTDSYIYMFRYSTGISAIYRRIYQYAPTDIVAIYAKVGGYWITTT